MKGTTHVHMMVWSADEKHGYLNKTGITAMRSALTNTIFQDEMHNIYVKKIWLIRTW